jgi:hypothetical protein
MGKEDVYIYTGDCPLIIVSKWSANSLGGPATQETTYMVPKGKSIDVSILGLVREEPMSAPKAPCGVVGHEWVYGRGCEQCETTQQDRDV